MLSLQKARALIALLLSYGHSAPSQVESTLPKPLVQFPFEEGAGNKLFVGVRLNDSGPLWFVVDTGAPSTHIDYDCAERLGLAMTDRRELKVGAGTSHELNAATTHGVSFDVHGQELNAPTVTILQLDHVAELMGRRVDGLLGNDFVKNYAFEIDYRAARIRLYRPEEFEVSLKRKNQDRTVVVPIDLSTGRPMVQAGVSVDGRKFTVKNLIVDTGANAALYLSQPVVAERRLIDEERNPGLVSGVISRGAGGDTRGAIARIDFMQLESLRVPEPVAIFSQDTSGFFADPRFDGIIGGELLRRSKVIFDHSRSRLILDPYENQAPIHYDKSGLLIRARFPEFEIIEVLSVLDGTPAAKADIRSGDRITHLGGLASTSQTLAEITEKLKQSEGTEVRLRLKRGDDETITATLFLRDYSR